MNRYALLLLLLVLPLSASAQRSMSEYTRAQQAVLRAFLAENPSLRFVPETEFNPSELRSIRSDRPTFKPYYAVGDYSRDGRRDFVVLLLSGTSMSNGMLHLVVFNQVPGNTYRVAYREEQEASRDVYVITDMTGNGFALGYDGGGFNYDWTGEGYEPMSTH